MAVGITVGPVGHAAAVGGDIDAGSLHDVATRLGQNCRTAEGAGQVGVQVDVATVNADWPVDADRFVHRRRVAAHAGRAVLAQRQAAQLVAGVGEVGIEGKEGA